MARARPPQFRLHKDLAALSQIEDHLAELLERMPRASGEIEDDEEIKQACIFLCRGVRHDDLSLVDRHVWVPHFRKIGLPSCSKIAGLRGDVSSVADQIQQKFEALKIRNAPAPAATKMIV